MPVTVESSAAIRVVGPEDLASSVKMGARSSRLRTETGSRTSASCC